MAGINFTNYSGLRERSRFSISKASQATQTERAIDGLAAPRASTLRRVVRLRKALRALKPSNFTTKRIATSGGAPIAAKAVSAKPIGFSNNQATRLRSTAEVNTAPTSFTPFGPNMKGSTATAPWKLGSSAGASVRGEYNGQDGSGTLRFQVRRGGTHGKDDLKIRAYAPDNSTIDTITISKNDPLNKTYTLSNGIEFELGAGELIANDEFTVEATVSDTSFTPTNPGWVGSTSDATIGGAYLGTNGTDTLKFEVTRSGEVGTDAVQLKLFDSSGRTLERINLDDKYQPGSDVLLKNGLTLKLGAGELIKGNSFEVDVVAGDPGATTPTDPDWTNSSALPTIGGEYNGAYGTDTLTFDVRRNGTVGADDLRIKVFDSAGNTLETVDIAASSQAGEVFQLASGLTLSLGEGSLIKNETFTVDVAAETSFSTTPHAVKSTAPVTIGGVYDGAQGTGDLSFFVSKGGTHGTDDLQLQVKGPDDQVLDTINISAANDPDKVHRLSNGLTFHLGAGELVENESFVIGVNHTIGSRVDPDRAFNGTRNEIPNFDQGLAVTAGSFEINGVQINVDAADTINTVLGKINASRADVTATFDAPSETIQLTRNTPGAQNSITLGKDTSGFLAATKLADAKPINDGEGPATEIAKVGSLASIKSGAFQINGTDISVNVDRDSLLDVVDRINASDAGVKAWFDRIENRIQIEGAEASSFKLDSGRTGFFEAVAIKAGTYDATPGEDGKIVEVGLNQDARRLVSRGISDVAEAMDNLFTAGLFANGDRGLAGIRSQIQAAIDQGVDKKQASRLKSAFGLRLGAEADDRQVIGFNRSGRARFERSMKRASGVNEFREMMFGSSSGQKETGVVDRLIEITERIERNLTRELGATGVYVDRIV